MYQRNKLYISFFFTFLFHTIISAKVQNVEYVKDEIFIRFNDDATDSQKTEVLKKYKLIKIRSFFITKAILFRIDSNLDSADLVKIINKLPFVKYSDLNRLGYETQSIGVNEPGFPYQWYLSGDFYGDKAETIKWKEAMELYSSKKNTVVAVVDSGIANFHPELEFKIAGMLAEQPSNGGISGQDDDGFGKVDDTHGWNFAANESNNEIENFPEDDHGHGTLVSGIISSESSNNEGFTGIAPDSYILPLRVRDGKSVSDLRIIEAVEYSIAANVKVINVSMRFLSYLQFSFVLQEATENLHLNHDCLIICAAGNYSENNDNTPTYPASYEGDAIISVAASDQNNELAKFSNFGLESVDLAAPGVDIWGPTISRNKTPVIEEYFDYNLGEWSWGSTPYNLSNYYWNYFVDAYGKTWVTDSDYDVNYDLLNYSPYSDTFLKSPIIDLRNVNFPELSVTVYHDLAYNWLLGSYDMLFFEISKDGINWFKLGSGVYGKTPYPGRRYSFDLSEFKNELVEVRFRISSDGIYQSDGVYIDDFIITGTSTFTYTGNEYKSNDGTSFAAPIVSGVAAMLLSHRPELSTQDVRKIILQSVTKVDGLEDKVASGGIVNAYEAIKLANTWEIETPTHEFFSFSSNVSPSNTGSVSGAGSYESGSTISISATPSNGYEFSHWSGDASGSSNPLSITINQDTSIVANFTEEINSYALSSSSSPSNSGTVSGDGTYNSGSTISISATPSNGYQFSHWSGDASGSSNPLSITINQDTSIVANFTEVINSHALSSSSSPSNSGTVSGNGTYNSGSTISISATPSNGYQFSHWSGDASGSSNPLSITINQDTSIVANFTEVINSYALSSSSSPSNSGTVSGDGTYNSGSTISISATPSNGYQFSHWSGDASGSSNPLSITINQDTSIVANFTEVINSYALSSSSSPSNSGTVSGDGTYNSGSTISISATPSNGYQFSHWSGDASGSSNPLSITINQDTSIVANFSVTGTNNTSNNSWSSAFDLGNGWRSFSWFGEFFEVSQNWIYHAKMGWLYRFGDDLNSLWFYSTQHGWLFTSKSIFPYLYGHNLKAWLYSSGSNFLLWNGVKWNAI